MFVKDVNPKTYCGCKEDSRYFLKENMFSELVTEYQKERARQNLGIDSSENIISNIFKRIEKSEDKIIIEYNIIPDEIRYSLNSGSLETIYNIEGTYYEIGIKGQSVNDITIETVYTKDNNKKTDISTKKFYDTVLNIDEASFRDGVLNIKYTFKDASGKIDSKYIASNPIPNVTTESNGLMLGSDKLKLDYIILDDNNRIDPSMLPSYVDDVVDIAIVAATLPTDNMANGDLGFNTTDNRFYLYNTNIGWIDVSMTTPVESGKIYIATKDGNKQYRWSGTTMVQITSGNLVIGEVTGTAFDGGRGKAIEDWKKLLSTYSYSVLNIAVPDSDKVTIDFNYTNFGTLSSQLRHLDIPTVTTTTAGVMSAADKVKLNSIQQSNQYDCASLLGLTTSSQSTDIIAALTPIGQSELVIPKVGDIIIDDENLNGKGAVLFSSYPEAIDEGEINILFSFEDYDTQENNIYELKIIGDSWETLEIKSFKTYSLSKFITEIPKASNTKFGGVKIGFSGAHYTTRPVELDGDGRMFVDILTANNVDTGLLTSEDYKKFNNKQDALVSGTNIKTINNQSILGSGNIEINSGTSIIEIALVAPAGPNSGYENGDIMYQTSGTKGFYSCTVSSGACTWYSMSEMQPQEDTIYIATKDSNKIYYYNGTDMITLGEEGLTPTDKANLSDLVSWKATVSPNVVLGYTGNRGEAIIVREQADRVQLITNLINLSNGQLSKEADVSEIVAATSTTAGIMSAEDKGKLDDINDWMNYQKDSDVANNKTKLNNLPVGYVVSSIGLPYNFSETSGLTLHSTTLYDGHTYDFNVPFASSTKGGFMSASDKSKLDTLISPSELDLTSIEIMLQIDTVQGQVPDVYSNIDSDNYINSRIKLNIDNSDVYINPTSATKMADNSYTFNTVYTNDLTEYKFYGIIINITTNDEITIIIQHLSVQ